jgi:hypothetical protein
MEVGFAFFLINRNRRDTKTSATRNKKFSFDKKVLSN